MNSRGYSLVEVLVAAAIVAVGLTAAAVLSATLMQQQELNAATLRAANVQEQAVKLYRLDLGSSTIRNLLPDPCVSSGTPPPGGYRLSFGVALGTNVVVGGLNVALDRTRITLVYSDSVASGFITNEVYAARPTIRVKYTQ